ncbi:MAG TPA: hypothetical protein VNE42_11920 [Acidimicrobiales bacterium]|nr:hypothetical protein [Acidimicrobiales bacterium]
MADRGGSGLNKVPSCTQEATHLGWLKQRHPVVRLVLQVERRGQVASDGVRAALARLLIALPEANGTNQLDSFSVVLPSRALSEKTTAQLAAIAAKPAATWL